MTRPPCCRQPGTHVRRQGALLLLLRLLLLLPSRGRHYRLLLLPPPSLTLLRAAGCGQLHALLLLAQAACRAAGA